MARQGRLHVPYATYFVVNRFRPGVDVLVPASEHSLDAAVRRATDLNRRRFEKLLAYVCTRWGARIHAYCWLPDSAQLLIQIFQVPLEHVLHSLRGPYSHYLRSRLGCRSPVYPGRYFSLLIDPEELLLDFARHMFWIPVNAGLSKSPLGYEYSSARACLGERPPPFLHSTRLTDALAAKGISSRTAFAKFLASHPSPRFASLLAHGSRLDNRIAGAPDFVRTMQRLSRAPRAPVKVTAVLSWVSGRLGVAAEDIVGRSRYHTTVRARALVAWLATCLGPTSLSEISRRFPCGPSTLHRAICHYARLRPGLFSYETLVEFEMTVVKRVDVNSGSASSHAPTGPHAADDGDSADDEQSS